MAARRTAVIVAGLVAVAVVALYELSPLPGTVNISGPRLSAAVGNCTNGIQDGNERGVDCGGNCASLCDCQKSDTISAGNQFVCAISDGESGVRCWGSDNHKQSSAADSFTSNFTHVSAGFGHVCALPEIDVNATDASSNFAVCWGDNAKWQASPPPAVLIDVAAGKSHTCGLLEDSTAVCWGDDGHGQIYVDQSLKFDRLSTYKDTTCGILSEDKSIYCWGRYIAQPPKTRFQTVSVGLRHVCGVTENNTVECWGNNIHGQIEVPTARGEDVLFKTVSASEHHTCATRLEDGIVQCWGWDWDHQCEGPQNTPLEQLSSGGLFTCGTKSSSTSHRVLCWGRDEHTHIRPPSDLKAAPLPDC